jgi:streptogramin lyase
MRIKRLITSFLLVFCCQASGQIKHEIDLNVQSYKTQNGLPSNNINFIFQDKTGFIWIGTYTGLSKYNGYQFTNFMPNPNGENTVKVGQYISYLKVSDSIYFLTTKLDGIQRLNVVSNTMTRLKNSPAAPKNITKDKDGTYWISTLADGFYHYFPQKNHFEHILFTPLTKDFKTNWNSNTVNDIYIDKNNDSIIWLGCRMGLYAYNKISKTFKHYKVSHHLSMHEFALNQVTSLVMDMEGNIWTGKFFGGLGKFNPKTSNWEHYYFNPEAFKLEVLNTNIIHNLRFLNPKTLSLSTDDGPMHFDIQTKTFTKFNLLHQDDKIIGNVIDGFIDKDSNQWFSNILQNGVALVTKRLNATTKIKFPEQNFKPDYYSAFITDMFWSAKYKRYFIANVNHDGLLTYSKDFELIDQITIPCNWKDKEPFPNSIGEDNEGMIWITDITNQLIKYNPISKKIENHKNQFFNACSQIHRGTNEALYFQTEKGLFKYKNNTWSLAIENAKIELISNIKSDILFYIENLDVFSFNLSNNQKKKLIRLPKFAVENNNYIQNIYADNSNRLWIPLEFGGIYLYELDQKKLKLLSFEDGLKNNLAREVKADKNGNVFVMCNGAFYYFDESKKIFIDFDNLTHQKTNDWNEHGLFFTNDNELVVTKDNAFYVINQNHVLQENKNAPVITDLYSAHNHFINDFNAITIPNNQSDVKLFFSNFDYSSINELVYEYQLVGVNKQWERLDKGVNQIGFANLAEGTYLFKVRLLGEYKYTTSTFKITTKWYKSQWFYICLITLLLLSFSFLILYFYNKKTKEKELQKRIAELKLIALQSQLNPHFLFNCLTSISGLIKTKEYDKSEKILNDFAKLMRAILTNSQKDLITIEEEIKISTLYLQIERIRKDACFDFEFILDENLNQQLLIPPLMLQPYLENCIKHGFASKTNKDKGKISVSPLYNNKNLTIKIEDNGSSNSEISMLNKFDSFHQSIGINLQSERLKQYYTTHKIQINVNTNFDKLNGGCVNLSINYF